MSASSSLYKAHNALPWTSRSALTLRSTMAAELDVFSYDIRLVTVQAKAPSQARQMGALKVSMLSPGFVYEPCSPREPIPFWQRWFTRSGWKRTKENISLETLKNEIKQRETIWSKVYWELVEPVIKMQTLRARLIGVDRNDVNKVFIQLTIEFLTKQKFEAYDLDGKAAAGDKSEEVLVKDIWVFEKSLFHTGAFWRLFGRIIL